MKDHYLSVGKGKAVYYLTKTGKKYHIDNCPYCRRGEFIPATRAIVENQKLLMASYKIDIGYFVGGFFNVQ